ncbi:MAG: hypothetical protein F6K23_36090 [Okeania sp. SIO2C9]|nr:hypothetical protein [Okeania sp. SIO2C9]
MGKEINQFQHDGELRDVVFTPDGKYVATASRDKTARVWDVTTGKQITKLHHDGYVNAVEFTPDGKYIATASDDYIARVWDVATSKKITKLRHDGSVNAVEFSPGGKYIATASADNTAWINSLNTQGIVNEVCRRSRRNLTAEEWQRYMNQPLHQYQKTCTDLPVHSSLISEAKELAQEDKVEEAEKLLGAVIKLDDKIDLLPKTEVIDQKPVLVVRQFQAEGKVEEGVKLAKQGKVESAISMFKEAQKLQSDVDLNSDTEEIETDAVAVAKKLAAPGKVEG